MMAEAAEPKIKYFIDASEPSFVRFLKPANAYEGIEAVSMATNIMSNEFAEVMSDMPTVAPRIRHRKSGVSFSLISSLPVCHHMYRTSSEKT